MQTRLCVFAGPVGKETETETVPIWATNALTWLLARPKLWPKICLASQSQFQIQAQAQSQLQS